ncbi:hypothetical protein ABE197_05080 [Bacillus subtilis]
MNEDIYIKELDKLINKFIFRSRQFIEYAAHLYGFTDLMITGEKIQNLHTTMSISISQKVQKA